MRRVSSVWQLGRLRAFAKASNRSEVITKAAPLQERAVAANRPAEWALADGGIDEISMYVPRSDPYA